MREIIRKEDEYGNEIEGMCGEKYGSGSRCSEWRRSKESRRSKSRRRGCERGKIGRVLEIIRKEVK